MLRFSLAQFSKLLDSPDMESTAFQQLKTLVCKVGVKNFPAEFCSPAPIWKRVLYILYIYILYAHVIYKEKKLSTTVYDFFSTGTACFRAFRLMEIEFSTCFPCSFSKVPFQKSSRQFLDMFDPSFHACMPSRCD